MSFPLSARSEVKARSLPVARGRAGVRDALSEARVRAASACRENESRLQAAVGRPASGDPYADVPCTD